LPFNNKQPKGKITTVSMCLKQQAGPPCHLLGNKRAYHKVHSIHVTSQI